MFPCSADARSFHPSRRDGGRSLTGHRATEAAAGGRRSFAAWWWALTRTLHDIACLPALGGCAEELIDSRASREDYRGSSGM